MSVLSHLAPALPFLLTYAVHSSVLLLCAWVGDALLGESRAAEREGLWRFALVGALLSASLQVGLGLQPLTGRVELLGGAAPATETAEPEPPTAFDPWPEARSATSPRILHGGAVRVPDTAPASASRPRVARARGHLAGAVATLWLLVAALLVLRLAIGHALLHRRLADREPLGGRLRSRLDDLLAQAGMSPPVALTSSSRLSIPVALCLGKPEICLPQAAVEALDPSEQDAVLAHELAHLRRRDPQWILLARLLEGLLFFQPLHRTARRRLEELAELRSDDWASAALGCGLGLARCLATVAGWQLSTPSGATASLAARRSQLRRRIERLLEPTHQGEPMSTRQTSPWMILAGLVVVALITVAAPGVSLGPPAAQQPPPPPPRPSTAPPAPRPAPDAPQPAAAPSTSPAPAASPAPAPAPPSPVPRSAAAKPTTPPTPQEAESAPEAAEREELEAIEEAELALEEEIEAMEEIERALEEELEAMEKTMEQLELDLEETLAPLQSELEVQIEALETEIELELEPLLEELEKEIGEDPSSPSAQQRIQDVQQMLRQLQPSIQQAVEIAMRAYRPLQDEIMQAARTAYDIDHRRLQELAQRMAAAVELGEAERRALDDEMRRLAAEALPDAEELAALQQRARAAARAARPTAGQMEALRRELEEAAERMRERLAVATEGEGERQENP